VAEGPTHGDSLSWQANRRRAVQALHDILGRATSIRFREVHNYRHNCCLTFRQWARNFEANREAVVARFGEFHYRRFRLYLWGAAYEFLSRSLDCYRMVIHRPAEAMDDPL
jgi:cyclopropane-fatty-acyl-phospholipid synthase